MYLITQSRLACSYFLIPCQRLLLSVGLLLLITPKAIAQIIPDRTLPTHSTVDRNGNVHRIRNGTTRGGNLFHSFQEFSLPTGETAFFDNPTEIQRIITRVTGASASEIDGLIRANGSADLFLINPNGIMFGANARLDIGGSFIGSTANSIQFPDGIAFSATHPQTTPLLTVSAPIGLQYGSHPGRIAVQGPGNQLSLDPDTFAVQRDQRPVGLQVPAGETLALLGGNITLQGGNLTAAGGRIELGSVASPGTLALAPVPDGWTVQYGQIARFGTIRLTEAASADASGAGAGNLRVRAGRLNLTHGSSLLTLTTGGTAGGQLNIRTSDSVKIQGTATDPQSGAVVFGSSLYADVAAGATGRGADLTIRTRHLQVADGGQVSATTIGAGNAGALTVSARTIDLLRGAPVVGASGLFASVNALNATGSAGNITIQSDRLRIQNGAAVVATTFGAGNAGNVRIDAGTIEISGTSPGGTRSEISAQVDGGAMGQGGDVMITADRLHLLRGGQITVSTLGSGDGGNLSIKADEAISLQGITEGDEAQISSLIRATVESFEGQPATGAAGNIHLETNQLQLRDGAQIAVATNSTGNAGDLVIRAEAVDLAGASLTRRSGLFASAIVGTGNGGNIRLNVDRLTVREGATISASNFSSINPDVPPGQGAAGNLYITADEIHLEDEATLTASTAVGDRGNIFLHAHILRLDHESAITTNSQGAEPGGNITMDTTFLVAQNNSDITANATHARGGQVVINAQAILGTEFRPHPTPGSDITASSDLGAEFNGVVQLNTLEIDPAQGAIDLPTTPLDASTQIVAVCERSESNEFLITGRGGLPMDASQPLPSQALWQDLRLRDLEATDSDTQSPPDSDSGRMSHSTVPSSQPAIVEAQGWAVDTHGQITLVANSPQATGAVTPPVPYSPTLSPRQCPARLNPS